MNQKLFVIIYFLFLSILGIAKPISTVYDVTKFGATGDGKTLNTSAIQKTIDECSRQGGGVVLIPDGTFISGTILLKNNVTLMLNEKAKLLGSVDIADYQVIDGFKDGRGSSMGYCFIGGTDAKNCGISGKGKINGNGKLLLEKNGRSKRPFLVRFVRCTNLVVSDVSMEGPAAWTMHFFECKNARAERVIIRSRGLGNNDGIDIDSCDGVVVKDCDIDSGDDAVCLKSTGPEPCRHIEVSGCKLNTGQGAFKIGTESYGDFEYINFHDCQIESTKGIKIYSVDGAHLKNLKISDLTIDKTTVVIMIRLGTRLKTFREGNPKKTAGSIENLQIKDIKVNNASQIALLISGIPGSLIENVKISGITVLLSGGGKAEDSKAILPENEADYPEVTMFGKIMPTYGVYIRHAKSVKLDQINLTTENTDARPIIVAIDVARTSFNGSKMVVNQSDKPIMITK